MRAKDRALLAALIFSGAVLAWTGGFMLSSKNSRCIDGAGVHECSGAFTSDAWHGVGLGFVIAGLVFLLAGLAVVGVARRRCHTNAP